MSLVRVVLDVHAALSAADVPHAYGGALAYGYYARARGTEDADLSVFVGPDEISSVLSVLAEIGFQPVDEPEHRIPIAGIPFQRPQDPEFLDVFPALAERYAEIEARCVLQPYGPELVPIPFLAVEDVVLFKLSFGRDKDWIDLRVLAEWNPDLDVEQIADLLLDLRGASMHPRIARFRAMLREARDA